MVRRLLVLCLVLLVGVAVANAADTTSIQGKVTDSSGAAISGAIVSLKNLTTAKVIQATTDAEGQFVFMDVPSDPQLVTIEKSGFESFAQCVSPTGKSSTAINATLNVATLSESVVVRGTVDHEAKPMPTREDVMVMPGTVRVLDRKQLDAA
jgi:hypothetical protein